MQERFKHSLPKFPKVTLMKDVTSKQRDEVLSDIMMSGRMSMGNVYRKRGETFKSSFMDSVKEIIISSKPINEVSEQDSFLEKSGLHACFVGEKGKRGVAFADTHGADKFTSGTLHQDAKGRGWFLNKETGKLEPVSFETYDFLSSTQFEGRELNKMTPVSGRFMIRHQHVFGHDGCLYKKNELSHELLGWLLFEGQAHEIVKSIFTEKAYHRLLDKTEFPINGPLSPKTSSPMRNDFDDAMTSLCISLMEKFRDGGHLEKCPNNGPRSVRCMEVWNSFVGAGEKDYHDYELFFNPAFAAIRSTVTLFFSGADTSKSRITREQAENGYQEMLAELCEVMAYGEHWTSASDSMTGLLNREYYALADTFYKPVLALAKDPERRPLPVLEEPKILRHYTLDLPSGRLAMADWFRIPGFSEAINTLTGVENGRYDLNFSAGLNERAKDYLTKTGVAIVHVGNSSPRAFHHNGVWAMGHVDEDSYYDEDGEPIGDGEPEPVWNTCTDLWANTFASPEAIVKVLMTSGEYETEEEAEEALTQYCNDRWGANIVDLGVNKIHVYAPTGYQENKYDDIDHIDFSNILSQHEMCGLKYLISDHELDINATISVERWEAPIININSTSPSI